MKQLFTIILILSSVAAIISGCEIRVNNPFAEPQNSVSIGGVYKICCCGKKPEVINPFNPSNDWGEATVIVTDMKDGFIQYAWEHEYKKDKSCYKFSRDYKAFNYMINNCKQ